MGKWLGLQPDDRFGTVLARNRGMGPGFDLLRIALAFAIFVGHAKWLAGGESFANMVDLGETVVAPAAAALARPSSAAHWSGFTLPLKLAMVPGFFALSGFLVTGSAVRLRRTSTFLAHRGLRIFPALSVEVLLSALLLGPFFTTLALGAYFQDAAFFRYFGNIVGHITFHLPGVFQDARVSSAVNLNLWTLRPEFYCYLVTAALMIVGWEDRRRLLTGLFVVAFVGLAIAHALYGISARTPYPGHVIVLYFFAGMVAFHWRDHIRANWLIFLACGAALYVLMLDDRLIYACVPLLTYCVLFVGMLAFPRLKLLQSGDYSYGIYLYGFPICQGLLTLVPWFNGRQLPFILAAAVLTCLFAYCSWHLVEKRVLKLKHRLPERWFPTTPRERLVVIEA